MRGSEKKKKGSEVIFISVKLYNFFLANGKTGRDALRVYWHLMATARKQKTNQVWATNGFICKGTGLCAKAVTKAEKWMVEKNLIQLIKGRKEKGKWKKTFIKIVHMPGLKRTQTVEDEIQEIIRNPKSTILHRTVDSGGPVKPRAVIDRQVLELNNEFLEERKELLSKIPLPPSPSDSIQGTDREEDPKGMDIGDMSVEDLL